MKLIVRFWNGNKKGPLGTYPLRQAQLDRPQLPEKPQRYRGEMMANPGGLRVNWDRYLGHNIACIAVDGNGEIIDFDFNHNDFFRSSAEHAESRMVRRLFSLTDVFDGWKTGKKLSDKPHLASLNDVTLYTSLESCAQCSGVMSLAGVRQIVYLQNDFTAYKIGNLMYNLANRTPGVDSRGNAIMDWQGKPVPSLPGAPIPIAGSEIQLDEFEKLNDANLAFSKNIIAAKATNDKDPTIVSGAFFIPDNGKPDFSPSITSFLCTDPALKIFQDGAAKFDVMNLDPVSRDWKFPNRPDNKDILTNQECLDKARAFFIYADTEGYRGSPHKL
ncbi:deaminase [Bradyrhizobium sp. LA6.1]|uniref:deaminase n=1 Tax=Bradyrhizobium sp. LA6.1 TaxID=3156378 RepID=UPI00339AE02A